MMGFWKYIEAAKNKKGSGISLFNKKKPKLDEEEEEEEDFKYKGFKKDPSVNTSFLKDEEKEIEDEIRKKAETNRVNHISDEL